MMPPGVTTFTLVADASHMGIGQMNLGMMKALLKVITAGYPDRMGRLFAGPVNFFLRGVYGSIKPLMAKRLVDKIVLMATPAT